jgi:putative salt-induced outer membrane protein
MMWHSEENMKRQLVLAGLILLASLSVFAQEEAPAETQPDPWKSALGLSYVDTSGNSDTEAFGLDFKVERLPEPWGFEIIGLFNRASNEGELTAERYYLGGRAKRALSDRWELFGGLSGEKDEFAGFDMRLLAEAGVVYKLLLGPTHLLSFDAGITYTDEDRLDPSPDEAWFGGVLGLAYEWKITDTTSFTERVLFYPNFEESSDWRLSSDTGIQTAISSLLALKFGYEYRYRNEPLMLADGSEADTTDTTTRFSVVFNFGPQRRPAALRARKSAITSAAWVAGLAGRPSAPAVGADQDRHRFGRQHGTAAPTARGQARACRRSAAGRADGGRRQLADGLEVSRTTPRTVRPSPEARSSCPAAGRLRIQPGGHLGVK